MKKKFLVFGGTAVAAVAAFMMLGEPPVPPGSVGPTASQTQSALSVTVAPAETGHWSNDITASGWITAWQEAVISAELSGEMITAINADVGDTVSRGDVLVELSSASTENTVKQLEAALEVALATLDQATADADRARRLSENGSGSLSQQQVTEYLASERKAQADVTAAQAQLDAAQLDLEHTRIVAVSSGRITSRDAMLGDVVSQGQELFRMIRDNRIEWHAEVPLSQVFALKQGTGVTIETPVGNVTGHVRRIAPTASDTSGRVTVYVALDPMVDAPDPMVGIMISGKFHIGETDAVYVPSTAVVLQDGFSYVFVLDPEDETKVARVRVETGRRSGDDVEIIGEFSSNYKVVQSGGAFLTDGATVTVIEGTDE